MDDDDYGKQILTALEEQTSILREISGKLDRLSPEIPVEQRGARTSQYGHWGPDGEWNQTSRNW